MSWPILSVVTFLPTIGALAILAVRGGTDTVARAARWIALITTLIDLALAVLIWVKFDNASAGFQFVEHAAWIGSGITYHMGVDGISMLFIVLTAGLMPFCILASWESIETRVAEYMIAFLVLETLMIGVFCALDLVLFYLFFEGGLIPMFLIIGVWGGKRRVYASFKFFLYTLLGSVLMLLAILAMYVYTGTTDIDTILRTAHFPAGMQTFLWLAFFASFAVKMPMWPVHTWLPDAHVEAPTAGSVILAGILLKMGGYGFLRFSVPMFAQASTYFTPFVFVLSIVAIIYTSLVALAQEDMKKLIAYSSVAHMGFVTMGIFTFTRQGIDGGIFQMLSHGVVSGALFLCVGVIYDRMHTREIDAYGGLVNRMPMYAAVFMVFTLANVGLPGTSGFVGEFLTLLSAFAVNTWVAIFATSGVILSVAYALYLYRRIIFGSLVKPTLQTISDLSLREVAIMAPLVAATIVLGVYPKPIFAVTGASVQALVEHEKLALSVSAPASREAAREGDPVRERLRAQSTFEHAISKNFFQRADARWLGPLPLAMLAHRSAGDDTVFLTASNPTPDPARKGRGKFGTFPPPHASRAAGGVRSREARADGGGLFSASILSLLRSAPQSCSPAASPPPPRTSCSAPPAAASQRGRTNDDVAP